VHLIVIVCDTLRWDFLQCYGNDWVLTPHISALASQAVVFDRAYTASFPTVPHRRDLMSGRYTFPSPWTSPPGALLQSYLQRAGYATQLISDHVQLLIPGITFLYVGFDGHQWVRGHQADCFITDHDPVEWPCAPEKLRSPERLVIPHLRAAKGRVYERQWHDPATVAMALDWLERNYRQERFYLYLDLFGTHEPWDPPRFYRDLYDPGYDGEEVLLPRYDFKDYLSEREIQHVRALYAGMITMMDRWLGRLFESLRLMQLWDKTAILLTADHGWYHGEHGRMGKHTVLAPKQGWPLYEEVNHIPLILRVPGLGEGGRQRALVQPTDIAPTLLDIAGVPLPGAMHGASLLPLLRGEVESVRPFAVSSPTLTTDGEQQLPVTVVSEQGWSLIDGGHNATSELYYLPDDPGQERDLIATHGEQARAMHRQLLDFLRSTGTDEERLARRLWPGEPNT
jgi:arylsulfatase A-like enzyme